MEKSDKKRILTRVLVVLAALTLLSCCFLGSTFARYVTRANGSAQVNVAKWDLSMTANGSTEVVVGGNDARLSPDDADWADGKNRIHKHAGALAMTIRNNGDVAADVDVTFSVKGYQKTSGGSFTEWSTDGIQGNADAPSEEEATTTLKIQVAVTTSSSVPAENATDWKDYGTVPVNVAAGNGVVYVYIRAVWDTLDDLGEDISDEIDTWLGENISAVVADISYTATQNSEMPDPTPSAP